MSQRWLFVLSCIALITSAFTFVVRGDIFQALGDDFALSQAQKGNIEGAVFIGMALSMVFGGPICDWIGMKKVMGLAFLSHILGVLGTIFAPHYDIAFVTPYTWLYVASLLMGCGNGLTEVAINPLAATLYPNDKTHYLNVLHAWWPGGLILGGISARIVGGGLVLGSQDNPFFSMPGLGINWQGSLCLIVIPALIYGAMLIPAKFPVTERVAMGVSNVDMFKQILRPMFLLWAFCMLLTASTELGPQKWQESVISRTTNGAVSGTLILVYTSGMMFVLRHFAGPISRRLSPVGMLTGSATLSCIGLYLLSHADSAGTAFAYATIFGLGIAFFWPTMLGVTAERFPKGGALAMALMGSVGNASIAFVLPSMGGIVDHYVKQEITAADVQLAEQVLDKDGILDVDKTAQLPEDSDELEIVNSAQRVGFSMAFRWISILPLALIFLFGAIAISDKARGGYKPEQLDNVNGNGV